MPSLAASARSSATPDVSPPAAGMQGMPGMPAAGGDTSGVALDRAEAARLGITFARAAERPVRSSVRAVGILKYAEPNLVYVNARVGGWVERLYADYVGKRVEQGDPLLALYSPDLVSAQEEYLLARRLKDDTLATSARRRLALWNVPSDQIDSLETRGSVTRTLTAGVAVENGDGPLRPGMYGTAALATAGRGRGGVSVPLEAVLPTGTKDLVFVNRGDGRFVPREVRVGLRGDSLVEIVEGLRPGDEVVASATFLLDSESNLAAAIQGLMLQMGMGLNMGGMQIPAKEGARRP